MEPSDLLPEAVQWSEGMLLAPQHFQQNDIYWHEQLRHRTISVQPYGWGLVELALNPGDLLAGMLTVERLHAVMPDGLLVQYPRPDDAPLRLDLKAAAGADAAADLRPLKVHLAVPLRVEGAASRASAIQRYASVRGAPEVDENTGEGRAEVARLRPRIELIAGDAVPPRYTALQLAEVRRDPGGAYALAEFHPPMLHASASGFLAERGLQERLAGLVRRVRERAEALAAESGNQADNVESADGRRLLFAVQQLTRALPALEVLVRARSAHPFDLYLGLAQLVGHVAALGADALPPGLEPYRHEDCMPGFHAALEYVDDILERVGLAFEALPFERLGNGGFARPIAGDASEIVVELKPRPGQKVEELAAWLAQARIGSEDLMPVLARRRLPGAAFDSARREDLAGITVRPGRALFVIRNRTIDVDDRTVPVIRPGRPLLIHGPENAQLPAAIVMYRPRPAP